MSQLNSSPHFPPAFYRVSIKALIRDGNKILFNYEKEKNYYALPGGGLNWGEDPREALKREVMEEIGCKVICIADQPTFVLPHIVHNNRDMDWFYNLIVCFEAKIDTADIKGTEECDESRWLSQEEIQHVPLFEGEESLRAVLTKEK